MMSQHINSMLEHLRVGPLKRTKSPADSDAALATSPANRHEEQQKPDQAAATAATTATTTVPPAVASKDAGVGTATALMCRGNGRLPHGSGDDVDNKRISVVINETRKRSLKDLPNGVSALIDADRKFDARKRYSISNGDLRGGSGDGKSRELSPAPRAIQQRKLSADMRIRCNANQFSDDYLIRRPIRLKSLSTNYEVYDSLHVKAIDVSVFNPIFAICHSVAGVGC